MCLEHVFQTIFAFDLVLELFEFLIFDLLLAGHDLESGLKGNDFTGQWLNFCIFFVNDFGVLFFLILELCLHESGALSVDVLLDLADIFGHLSLETEILFFPHFSFLQKLFIDHYGGSSIAAALTSTSYLILTTH